MKTNKLDIVEINYDRMIGTVLENTLSLVISIIIYHYFPYVLKKVVHDDWNGMASGAKPDGYERQRISHHCKSFSHYDLRFRLGHSGLVERG